MKYDWSTAEAWGKTSAALLGGTALLAAVSAFCATGLPVGREEATVVGLLAGLPVWVGAVCYAVLARSAARAWGGLLVLTLLFAGGAVLAVSLP